MRAVIQRVSGASVCVEGQEVGACGRGLLILLGISPTDTQAEAQRLWDKIYKLRIFEDATGKMNLSLADVDGEALVVSQFTLYGDCRRGNRPSFTAAAPPSVAIPLYEHFCSLAENSLRHVGRGVFGADMQVSLTNDGPVTICLDTTDLTRPKR